MGVLVFLVFGLIVGFIARAIMPGRQNMGIVPTMLIGIVGSFIGGFLGNLIAGRPAFDLHSSGWIGSIIGALVVLALLGVAGRRVHV